MARWSRRVGALVAPLAKAGLAGALLVGVFGGTIETLTALPAAGAAPTFIVAHGWASFTHGTTLTATVTTVLNMVTGGKASVDTASLAIVTAPASTRGTVTATHTATHAYITFKPAATVGTANFSVTFGICAAGVATYSATSATCKTEVIDYAAGASHPIGERVIITLGFFIGTHSQNIKETISLAPTGPSTLAKTSVGTYYVAPPPVAVPAKEGTATVTYGSTVTAVIQMPPTATFTLVPTSLHVIGGTPNLGQKATVKYCTAAGTGCTATINTGNYKTVYPYIEFRLPTHIAGGQSITFPAAAVSLKAVGTVGHVGHTYLTQFKLFVKATDLGIGVTVPFDGYPTTATGTKHTPPPYKAPTAIQTVNITAPLSPPTVTSVTPATGTTAGGTAVTIHGTSFKTVTAAKFATVTCTTRAVTSTTTITCKTPAHAAGAVTVKVTNAVGSGTKATAFTYKAPAPTVTSFTPTSGTTLGGTVVTVTGTNLTGATKVTFGTTAAASFTVTSATTIKATTAAHAAGAVKISVTTPGGTATSTGTFTFVAPVPKVTGYWTVAADGGVFTFGAARFYGSTGSIHLNSPIVAMAPAVDGTGYWLVASDGGIFSFGSARFYGSMGGKPLNSPIVGMAAMPTGKGYWEVAADGGIFSFGTAHFYGSMGGKPLNKPMVGMAAMPTGHGYWTDASDGGIFSYGTARFYGSMGGKPLNKPMVGMSPTPTGHGYWTDASDGGIFTYGAGTFFGSMGGKPLNKPMVGMATYAP